MVLGSGLHWEVSSTVPGRWQAGGRQLHEASAVMWPGAPQRGTGTVKEAGAQEPGAFPPGDSERGARVPYL